MVIAFLVGGYPAFNSYILNPARSNREMNENSLSLITVTKLLLI